MENVKEVIADFHDNILGHIAIFKMKDSRLLLFIGQRDIEYKDGKKIGSGFSLYKPIHDCKTCALAADNGGC